MNKRTWISDAGVARLKPVIAWLRAGTPHVQIEGAPTLAVFDMHHGVNFSESICGTTCCIAGAVCQFNEPFQKNSRSHISFYLPGDASGESVFNRAIKLLGIPEKDALALFTPDETSVDWDKITPSIAADVTEAFIKTGKVEWPRMVFYTIF